MDKLTDFGYTFQIKSIASLMKNQTFLEQIQYYINCGMIKDLFVFIILFSATLSSQTELKFNLASAPFLVPNIGIEVKISERLGYQLDTSASFYDNIEGSPFHMTQIFNEFRFYPKNKNNKT